MDFFLQLVVNGVVVGSIYALVALGFVVIYKSSSILNFAQGEFLMLGAYVCLAIMTGSSKVPFWAAFLLTLGFSAVLKAIVQGIWGTDTRPFPQVFPTEPIHLGPFPVSQGYLWSVACVT